MKNKNFILVLLDIVLINLAYILALYLRFDEHIPARFIKVYLSHAIFITLIKIVIFHFFNLYKNIWKFASVDEMIEIVLASIVSNSLVIAYLTLIQTRMPRSVYLMVPILDMAFVGGIRFSFRALSRVQNGVPKNLDDYKKVLIVGAGSAGSMIIKELRTHDTLKSMPVAIVDDDIKKEGQSINGVPILGNRRDIQRICKKEDIDEIIIAIPSANRKEIREIVSEARKTNCKTKIVPGMYELIDGKVSIKKIRDVEIEDLLGREEIKLDMEEICGYIKNKRILVTGGGGSIGSELCRQIARFEPRELIILDIYENNAYDIQNELLRKYDNLNLKVLIASIRDKKRIDEIMNVERPDVIFHAAAHKHVPLMENNPHEAVKNNVFGTLNMVQAADKYNVKK
ncbi:MAG TPA: polysaccharide biosynthesis protein, partial [Tissierellales bacterium]|nr:polysaccharide biosynthesis protein [Tissierellales bacterium]